MCLLSSCSYNDLPIISRVRKRSAEHVFSAYSSILLADTYILVFRSDSYTHMNKLTFIEQHYTAITYPLYSHNLPHYTAITYPTIQP